MGERFRWLVAGAVAVALLAVVLALLGGPPEQVRASARGPAVGPPEVRRARVLVDRPPNIVLILTDDMRLDELRFVPAVRRLIGSRGVRFTHARSGDSLCCPARATLLTGKVAHNHRVLGNAVDSYGGYRHFARFNDVDDVLPVWLRALGYRTGYVGKYLNGFVVDRDHDQPGWSEFAVVRSRTYDYRINRFWINGRRAPERLEYRETYQRRLLLDLIRRWGGRETAAPYFIWYNSLAPHTEHDLETATWPKPVPEPRYAGSVRDEELTVSPAVWEDVSDKPAWVRYRAGVTRRGFHRELARARAESLRSVDATVRKAYRLVAAQGDLDRTVFVFASDNGHMLGEHGLESKAVPFQESTRIPLLAVGPGFRGGVAVDQEVALSDLTATVLRAAGEPRRVTARHDLDGLALHDFVGDPAYRDRRPTLLEGNAQKLLVGEERLYPVDRIGRGYRGVVWRDWLLVRYLTGEREFYDLGRDPWQLTNRYRRGAPAGSRQALLGRWLTAHADCARGACNAPLR